MICFGLDKLLHDLPEAFGRWNLAIPPSTRLLQEVYFAGRHMVRTPVFSLQESASSKQPARIGLMHGASFGDGAERSVAGLRTHGGLGQYRAGRPRSRLRIGSCIQPRFQKDRRPVAERLAVLLLLNASA